MPLGLKVVLRALAWGSPYADDFVILDYTIVNISGTELRDVYVGFWNDTTVGNTEQQQPLRSPGARALELLRRPERRPGGPTAWCRPSTPPTATPTSG